MALLQSQRNAVLTLIQHRGFDPLEFRWENGIIRHTPTGYGCSFRIWGPGSSLHIVEYSPGQTTEHAIANGVAWNSALIVVAEWLANLKREYEAPDLWAELVRQREIAGGAADAEIENTPFTPAEQAQVAGMLRELSEYVRVNYELSAGQLETIDGRLAYLEGAAKRVGRIDWRNLFVGTIVGLAVDAVIPGTAVNGLLVFGLRMLAGLFGGGGMPELPSGPGMLK